MKRNQISAQIFFALLIIQFLCSCNNSTLRKTPDNAKSIEIATSAKKPLIHFENPDFNFGRVYRGKIIEYIYKLRNLGNHTLEITKVKPSCGCTAVILAAKTIKPGKAGEIKVTFKTASYSGNINKSITVSSNDPDNSSYILTIAGEIIEEITIKPKNINFGTIMNPEDELPKTITVLVKSETEPDFTIKKITSSIKFVTTSVKRGKDGICSISVTLKGEPVIGRFNGVIVLETDITRQKRADIPFFGMITGDITTYPNAIYYSKNNVVQGHVRIQKLFIKINKKGIRVVDTKLEPNFLGINIHEEYDSINPHCMIEIKLPTDASIDELNGLLQIYTNSKKQPIIKIPIKGV